MAMLQDLPDEALVCVFSFVNGRELLRTFSLVCRRFRLILSSEWYWKRRFTFNFRGGQMPELGSHVNDDILGLQLSCMEGERVRMACDNKSGFMKIDTLSASTGGVDCVRVVYPDMNGTDVVLAAGSRDHIIYLWKRRVREEMVRSMREYISTELVGHRGWVWCLADHAFNQSILCSGSWDHDVRLWDISHGQCIRHIHKEHKAAVLSLVLPEPHLLLTGAFDKKVRIFDLRNKNPVGGACGSHSKPVLSLVSDGSLVYSGSEDKVIKIWDTRKLGEEINKIKCKAAVTSLCLNHGVLSAAVGRNVRLMDARGGNLVMKAELDPGHATPLTSVFHDLGMIISGSKDHSACIHTMTTPHKCLKTFTHLADVTDVHYRRGVLAVGSSDRTVSLWLPKNL